MQPSFATFANFGLGVGAVAGQRGFHFGSTATSGAALAHPMASVTQCQVGQHQHPTAGAHAHDPRASPGLLALLTVDSCTSHVDPVQECSNPGIQEVRFYAVGSCMAAAFMHVRAVSLSESRSASACQTGCPLKLS